MDQLFCGNYFLCNFMQYSIYQTEFHENSEFFFRFHGSTWKNSIKFHEKITWKKLYEIPWEEKPQWNSMKEKKLPWISMEFHVPNPGRIPWSSMETLPWNSMQGLYGAWKTWKVLEFDYGIFQDWKVLEKGQRSWKVLEIC